MGEEPTVTEPPVLDVLIDVASLRATVIKAQQSPFKLEAHLFAEDT